MAYRNKTFVSFASEDITSYRLMQAWKSNQHIDFDFHDAHDLNTARDTSDPATIKRRLRERLNNTKQVVLLASTNARSASAQTTRFIYYEVAVILELGLPIVFANLSQARSVESSRIPIAMQNTYTVSVSFQPAIIKYALDEFPDQYSANLRQATPNTGPHQYGADVYTSLGI